MSLTTSASSPAARPRPLRVGRAIRRWLFLVHRWLGVALALLMALWTLSGFVMMYVSYPETTTEERMAGLAPLDLSGCCARIDAPDGPIESASVEMLGGVPVLRWMGAEGPRLVGLGAPTPVLDQRLAGDIARSHMRHAFGSAPDLAVEPVDVDQWTLQQQRYAPLYKASFADERGTVLYVSGLTGEVVQDTHRAERFGNWLGAVPHWLYFTPLRKDGALWSQVVIWTSLLGTFLTVTGIYVGIVMYGRGGRGRSPFRGIALWHHWTGLIFGLVTLTWVLSGLASMQPWGWLESKGPGPDTAQMAGRPLEGADAFALVNALAAHPRPGVVSAEVSLQAGEPWAILVRSDGSRTRAAVADLAPAPPSIAELAALARAAMPGTAIRSQGLITEGDAYHYSHHTPAVLPAYRAIYADGTRLYLDPRTGEVVNYLDSGARAFRWWHSALHRLDFAGLNDRPLWDIVMLPLLAGVALVCLLGAWMGWRRLRRPGGPMRRNPSHR